MLRSAPKTIYGIPFLVVFSLFLLVPIGLVYSQSASDLEKEITEKSHQIAEKKTVLSDIEKKIAEIKGSNNSLSQKISLISNEIKKLEDSINETEGNIAAKLEEIENKQKELEEKKKFLDDISGDLYIETRNRIPVFFFVGDGWDNMLRGFYIKSSTVSFLKEEIEKINGDFSSLADAKSLLDKEKEDLENQKKDLDSSAKLLDEEKAKLQAELSKQNAQKGVLSAEITDLNKNVSQLQAALIAARGAGTISSGGSTDIIKETSMDQAPPGSFGVFSIGAYTHRNGMSQWGARARADAGQSTTEILNHYYNKPAISTGTVKSKGVEQAIMENISVNGIGSVSFEDYYLMGIKEMPESWNPSVLRAQAIAARTYAVWYVNNGNGRKVNDTLVKSICTSQSCQVFNTPLKTGAWKTAVEQTRGQIMVDKDGKAIQAEYAAVHGAWGNTSKWDTRSGSGDNWYKDSWEKASGVNWFYRSWYREGSDYNNPPKTGGETCDHSPYLSTSEMLTILNAYLIKNDLDLKKTPDKSRLLPSDYGQCRSYVKPYSRTDYGRTDKVPYSLEEMQNLLSKPVTSISSVRLTFSNGETSSVIFKTNRGDLLITGMKFKDIYNQMAPGHMRIQQQSFYAFFNIEMK